MIRKLMCWLGLPLLSIWGYCVAFGWFLYFEDKGFDLSKITVSNLFEMEDDFMELEDD